MKKKIGLSFLVLCVLFCFSGCALNLQLAGTEWENGLTTLSFTVDEVTISTDALITSLVNTYEYTCDMTSITYNDKTYEVEIDGDTLSLTNEGKTDVYTRVE